MSKDYYKILGIEKNASQEDVKKAFRKLAHQYHPDKTGGDASKFKEVNEAYGVLSDEKKRANYDAYGSGFQGGGNPFEGGGGFDFSGFQNQNGFQDFDLGDIFGEFFGGGGRSERQTRRGRDISVDVELSFSESVFGAEKTILLHKTGVCDHCKGTGGEPGVPMETCPVCSGKGKIRETRRSIIGNFSSVRTCDRCLGRGQIPREKCKVCKGSGVNKKNEEILVKIPPGIENGEMLRVPGKGEAISQGTTGDLYVKVRVKKHSLYKKDGLNLLAEIPVKLSTALLGGEYKLETLDGTVTVVIPAGIGDGEVLRVKGKGVPGEQGGRGDIYLTIKVIYPRKLSKDAKRLIEELKKEGI